ncbi:hypothetical protein [Burkholderia gladioli]|uniref:hypothetical protein n=1 Tax=Burkholderia gladioli TaxID=28095 RepID=UPI000B111E75|nr:hypothetical protein [Burkholderia gladioli]
MRHPIPLQGPLPEHERRALQLRHHLALARLLDRCHDPAPLGVLANVIRLAQALRGIASMPSLAACCRRADLALQGSFARGAPYRLDRAARDALEPLLALHDAQLAAVTVGTTSARGVTCVRRNRSFRILNRQTATRRSTLVRDTLIGDSI